jgi:DNA-binding NarL/FixJ family response regulator
MNKILIIEDDAQTRENLEIILEMEDLRVFAAPDGRTGLELARREHPDLVLCDVMMPGFDGHDVLRELRTDVATAGIPFIFLTARGERSDQRVGMNLGADDYLCKPVDAEDLLAAINARLQRTRDNQNAALRDTETTPDFTSAEPLLALGLTPREADVLLWVAQGKGNGEVAVILGLSEKTVKIHLGHIFEKLNVETRVAAALAAVEVLPRNKRAPAGG